MGSFATKKGARLHGDRRQRLDALGFVWQNGFRHLKLYKDREGHCRVPQQHLENEFRLGTWVATQRSGRSTLSTYRKQRLEELEFVWDVR